MDYRDSGEEAGFRATLRDWLRQHVPAGWRGDGSDRTLLAARKRWHQTLHRAGYAGLSWPVEYGGQGRSPLYDAILGEELSQVDAPPQLETINYLGRAIWTYATDEQRAQYLPALLDAQTIWCQGFSEPGAGSDLASLRTHAELDGDTYVVNGQKMWTSGAHLADWCILLVRTDPSVPKHRGISCLLTPVDAPGITVRPITLASGVAETSEMFLDNVRIPAANMLGRPGDGWNIAMSTFAYERGPGDVGVITRYRHTLAEIEQWVRDHGADRDPGVRRALADAYVRGEALRLHVAEQLSARVGGKPPGEEGSISKLLWIDAEQHLLHLAMDLMGAEALTGPDGAWRRRYLSTRPMSVYGGTEQIQLNIVAQRLLGMPRAPRT